MYCKFIRYRPGSFHTSTICGYLKASMDCELKEMYEWVHILDYWLRLNVFYKNVQNLEWNDNDKSYMSSTSSTDQNRYSVIFCLSFVWNKLDSLVLLV